MKAVALMYHDITPEGLEGSSGFPGGDATRYKVTAAAFGEHLRVLHGTTAGAPRTVDHLLEHPPAAGTTPLLLTFDDGGAGAARAADMLEAFGWRGHFFVTTGYLGRRAFLTPSGVRSLHARGHLIGSHSCTHPLRMAQLPTPRLRQEWMRSIEALAQILGAPVLAASVPGGQHSRRVIETAGEAGVRALFTSTPTCRIRRASETLVIGRFAMRRWTPASRVGSLAAGAIMPRLGHRAWWQIKAAARAVAGPAYYRTREWALGRSDEVRWGDELEALSEHPS